MSGQEQTNWCWSAATQTVCAWAGDVKAQVDVASAHVSHNGRPLSCAAADGANVNGGNCADSDGCAADCNDPHILSVVLKEEGRFSAYITQSAAPTFQQLQGQIDNNAPVPCRIGWTDGGGHFVVVMGWTIDANGNELVHVLDPDRAASGQPVVEIIRGFQDFVSAYTLSGSTGQVNYSYEVQ
jgi:hypothetical protein